MAHKHLKIGVGMNICRVLPVDIGSDFAESRFLALKKFSGIGQIEKIDLHLGLDGRFSPHFVRLSANLQHQFLLGETKKQINHNIHDYYLQ